MNLRYCKRLCELSLLAGRSYCLFLDLFAEWPPRSFAREPDTAEIVRAIELHDQTQAKALERYHALRHYRSSIRVHQAHHRRDGRGARV